MRIVIYLRRQDTMAEAYWGQYVMMAGRREALKTSDRGMEVETTFRFSVQWQMCFREIQYHCQTL